MHGIPHAVPRFGDGREVVVNWDLPNFDNAETWYTDSNGLEMQKRMLNKRSFQSEFDNKGDVAASNYYPINSAIAIRDEESDM